MKRLKTAGLSLAIILILAASGLKETASLAACHATVRGKVLSYAQNFHGQMTFSYAYLGRAFVRHEQSLPLQPGAEVIVYLPCDGSVEGTTNSPTFVLLEFLAGSVIVSLLLAFMPVIMTWVKRGTRAADIGQPHSFN